VNVAQTTPIADSWGMHGSGGWWILGAVVMMVFMGGMMWMMMRGMGGGSSQSSSMPSESPGTTPSALEILERRFAQGEISSEEYRERREVLANGGAESNGAVKKERLTAPSAGERRQ
jgi:putative membrane protein